MGEYPNDEYIGACHDLGSKSQGISMCIDEICGFHHQTLGLNCSLGVGTYGYDQGGQMAILMGNLNGKITASLAISPTISKAHVGQEACLASDMLRLPRSKRRIVVGDRDGLCGGDASKPDALGDLGTPELVIQMAQRVSGYSASQCTSDYDCIRADGSGYYVVSAHKTGAGNCREWLLDWDPTASSRNGFKKAWIAAPKDEKWGAPAMLDWFVTAIASPAPPPWGLETTSGAVARACVPALLLSAVYFM